MTPEEQRIAIAEACGWKPGPNRIYDRVCPWGVPPYQYVRQCAELPNYLSDLNAMNEAEESIPDNLRPAYFAQLVALTSSMVTLGGYYYVIHALASQRAEAFLKTLNLWIP